MDEVLLGKASIVERCLKRIDEEYVGHENELATNFTRQDSVVLNLQRAFEFLIRDGRLGAALGRELIAMVGFRNVAVHNYRDLDVEILCSILTNRLSDLRLFARQIVHEALP